MPKFSPALLLPIVLGLLASGCSKAADDDKGAGPIASGTAGPVMGASTAAAALPAVARSEKDSNDLFEFAFAYPAAAGGIPDLRKQLDAELDKQKAALATGAKEQQAEAKKDGFPYRALGSWTEWKVVTDLPGWLSLSADISDYQGGAHPNHGFDSLVWDRQANRSRAPIDLFVSKEALSQAIRKDFCAALNRQREEKRGTPIAPGSTDEFDQCIDPAASTIILGSSNRKAFDRIGVLVAPYEAGPYAEGAYEVTLPVTPAVLAAVKPEFRPTFVAGR